MVPGLAIFFCLALPWLNPFSPGPMIGAMPLLFTWACATGAGLIYVSTPQPMQAKPLMGLAASAWLAAALLSAVLGLLQYFGATGPLGVWVNTPAVGEAFANLRQRNQFASLTSIGLAALLWWLTPATAAARLQGDGDRTHLPPDAPQAATLAAAALLGVGNAASASRTGLMQLVLITGLALLWGGRHHPGIRRALLTAVLAYALATLALPWLAGLDPLSSGAWARLRDGDSACASRLTLWGNVLHLIAQKPWLGWGWGELDYAHFITLYPGGRFCDILDNAHNLPLHLAVELGVPAALVVCGGALWAVCRARPWRETAPMRQMAWAVLAVILLHSLLEYPLWYGPFQVAFGLCVWYLWRTRVQAAKAGQAPSHKTFRPLATVSIALVAIILVAK